MRRVLSFDHALVSTGWARDVRTVIEDGVIISLESGTRDEDSERIAGIALPGLPNLHCHAFQRGLAGLTERRGPSDDSFWTWREAMYRFLAHLTPDDLEAIAAFAYMEMLERGFTSVAEFHYLHHDPEGKPYADLGEMATRIAAAAARTGIGLTLLPSFYAYGGFGGAAPVSGQRRFLNDPDRFLALVERTRAIVAPLPAARVGIAPHSLRAVTPQSLRAIIDAVPHGSIHIHLAEQAKEVDDCIAWSGRRPVEWLLDAMPVDERWCLVHVTHMTPHETRRLAATRAVAGLCPLTEASLGDGVFDGPGLLTAKGRFGIGTDSNIEIDAAAELRQLEYSQRLVHRRRNMMTTQDGESTGRRLLSEALAGGTQALGLPIGAIEVGCRADIVVLDPDHPDLGSTTGDHWLDVWIFVAGRTLVKSVIIGGERIVTDGHHHQRDMITAGYRTVLARLAQV